jgi:hypothetical protein
MDITTNSDTLPDPFEVGDDDFEDEPTVPSVMKEPESPVEASPYYESEIAINSGQQSNQDSKVDLVAVRDVSPTPPLPPKDPTPLFKAHFVSGLPALTSPRYESTCRVHEMSLTEPILWKPLPSDSRLRSFDNATGEIRA